MIAFVAVAVLNGLIPDLVKATFGQTTPILVLAILAAATVFGVVGPLRSRSRPRGIGVVVNLRPVGATNWSQQRVTAAQAQANQHDDHFQVSQEIPADPDARRAALDAAYAQFHAKLTERGAASGATPVCLYLIARLPDAYDFARRLKYDVHTNLVVMQKPENSSVFYEAVHLGGHLRGPLSPAERRQAEKFLTARTEPLAPDAPNRVALIISLSPSNPSMVANAVHAARTGQSTEYAVSPDDRCRAALVISASSPLPDDRATFELTTRHIHQQWATWLATWHDDPEQRLFLAAPATIAAGLGHTLARSPIRFVPHTPN
ncbi:hypothetical protein [Goodfellowiella coeruleoviolacea]|uniref:hypothetical protein n=1 Tax=Goodfellowiella coeruleoviolacea TaxID=334858 RepID=UPI0020A45DC1|nr:hypothetical protein [Goodfellowiella coeruleoviolacea]